MPAKMTTSDRLKIKIFLKKGCGVIISVHGVTSKILSRDSNNNVNDATWPKFGNSSVSVREVITSVYKDLTRKTNIF